ncbi:MAG: hypothetical protein ABIM74_09855 [candidate division WOR-3 bacterium]
MKSEIALTLAILGTAGAAAPVHHPYKGASRSEHKEFALFPELAGGGWIPPKAIASSDDDEIFPKIAPDGSGNLWCVLQSSASYNSGYSTIEIYRSTDDGMTWERQAYINVDFANLSEPAIAVDVGANRMYLAFLVKFEWASDYDLAWASYDIQADTLANFQSGWLESSSDAISGSPAVATERGYTTNYAFVAWSQNRRVGATYYYTVKLAATGDLGASWTTYTLREDTNRYLGQVCIGAGDSIYPALMVGFKRNPSNLLADSSKIACFWVSYDRGLSWNSLERNFSPYYVHQISTARAFGWPYAVWAVQVAKSSTNSDIYLCYSDDNSTSLLAEYYIEDQVTLDSRMPCVVADGMAESNPRSSYFYLATYRGNPGAGNGNCVFKIAWAHGATEAYKWFPSKGTDTIVIENQKAFSVDIANRGNISLSSFLFGADYSPAITWCHEYGPTDHDIYFARTLQPAHDATDESPAVSGRIELLNTVNRGLLIFRVPDEMVGQPIKLYGADGRLVAQKPLERDLRFEVPSGVYIWQSCEFYGKTLIQR